MHELSTLCRFMAELRYDDIPAGVLDYTKLLIADHMVSAVAGYIYNPEFSQAITRVLTANAAEGDSTILFHDRKAPAGVSSFINAVYCHGADIDDGHREAEAHPGVAVIAAVLACAEELGLSGKETLTAVVVGYETFIRIAKSVLPGHLTRGFHTTSTVGALAAAAACAKLMNLDGAGVERAISFAATQASGLLIVCESGQAAKPLNPGRAAQTGILSAQLAKEAVDAPEMVFDSTKGFAHAFSDTYKPEALVEQLGESFFILDTYVKLYPSCRHTHATIEALKKYKQIYGPIHDAKEIVIHTYPIAVDIVGHNMTPKTTGDVKFSLPYVAACVAMSGEYSLDNLANFQQERDAVIAFVRRIQVIADDAYDDIPNGIRGAKVTVTNRDGTVQSASVDIARGEGDDRIGWGELEEKAASSCPVMTVQERHELMGFCSAIEQLPKFIQPKLRLDKIADAF